MTRTCEVFTGRYALAYPKEGKLRFVANSDQYFDLAKARLHLGDRVANGEAFPHEVVVEAWVHLQWFGEATCYGAKGEFAGVTGWLFPKQIE